MNQLYTVQTLRGGEVYELDVASCYIDKIIAWQKLERREIKVHSFPMYSIEKSNAHLYLNYFKMQRSTESDSTIRKHKDSQLGHSRIKDVVRIHARNLQDMNMQQCNHWKMYMPIQHKQSDI